MGTMGQGRTAQKQGSRFLEFKSAVVDRLKTINASLKQVKELENACCGRDNVNKVIRMRAEVREQIQRASDEWTEMEEIYKKEARKKRSKFTPKELEIQRELVKRLYFEIEELKEAQLRAYARGRTQDNAIAVNIKTLGQIGTYGALAVGFQYKYELRFC